MLPIFNIQSYQIYVFVYRIYLKHKYFIVMWKIFQFVPKIGKNNYSIIYFYLFIFAHLLFLNNFNTFETVKIFEKST